MGIRQAAHISDRVLPVITSKCIHGISYIGVPVEREGRAQRISCPSVETHTITRPTVQQFNSGANRQVSIRVIANGKGAGSRPRIVFSTVSYLAKP